MSDDGGDPGGDLPLRLDFLYTPSRDVATEARWFTEAMGARLVFAVESGGTRAAMIELTEGAPAIILTDHLDGERPILVYRTADLKAARVRLGEQGFDPGPAFEIPHGPCCSFRTPGGHRVALYEAVRPEATAHFAGRRDF